LNFLGEPLLVHKRTATSSNSRPNTSTSATFDQASDEASTDENTSAQNRNERSPVNIFCFIKNSNYQFFFLHHFRHLLLVFVLVHHI